VRVRRESPATGNPVVVHHPQRAELHMLGIKVISERKREVRIQPAVVGVAAFVAFANVDHNWPPRTTPI
jgi:hypothetical protein